MANIYELQSTLLDLFNEIENNDGEITEEQAELLLITEENIKNKLSNYYKLILDWKGDVDKISNEAKRLADRKKVTANKIEKLKAIMLEGVNNFGEQGKSGNKFIELPTARIYTKDSKSVNVNEVRASMLVGGFIEYCKELYDNGVLVTGEEADMKTVMDIVNNNIKEELEQDGEDISEELGELVMFTPFTEADFKNIKVQVSKTVSLWDLITDNDKNPIIQSAMGDFYKTNIKIQHDKTGYKKHIEGAGVDYSEKLTMADVVTNTSIVIK